MKRILVYVRISLIALFLIGCTEVSNPTLNKQPTLPSITKTATNKHYGGKFVWHDLLTEDISKAEKFYGGLFDWKFKRNGKYTVIVNEGKLIGGMMQVSSKGESSSEAVWLPSLSVKNVDAAVKYVQNKKGKVLKGPVDMPQRGRAALVSDPQGAQFVLLTSKKGDPLDATPQVGDWLWNELWTKNGTKSYQFYKQLGHYDSVKEKANYRLLKHNGKWRAGIRTVKDKDVKTHWIPVVRVADIHATSAKVTKLGGKVLMPADKSFLNGSVAVIADSTGALLVIQRWKERK